MGNAVVHFEVMGRDGEALQRFYGELFDWEFNTDNAVGYGLVQRDGNTSAEGIGIGGGVGGTQDGDGHATFYVEVADVEGALAKAEGLGATRLFGPEKVMDTVEIGLFSDPDGHTVGVVRSQG